MQSTTIIELPQAASTLERIGGAECLCGLPDCPGHPVQITGTRETIEFSGEEYDFLLGDLHKRMA